MMRVLHRVYVALVYLFLIAPIAVVMLASLTTTNFVTFPPRGLTLAWYAAIFAHPEFVNSLTLSLVVGAGTALVAGTFGTLAAVAIVRERVAGAGLWLALLSSPLVIPTVVLGIALLQWFTIIALPAGVVPLVIGHTVLALPYVVRLVCAGLAGIDPALERAAAGLGASPLQRLRRVTLPLIAPSVIAGGLFAFITSFDDLTVALFVVSTNVMTLPVRIYNYMQFNYDPLITSVSTVMIVLSIALVIIVERVIGVGRLFGKAAAQ
jgi:putative spermidine/putrescine transport system permease protein